MSSAVLPLDARKIASVARQRWGEILAAVFTLIVLWQGIPDVYDAYTAPRAAGGDFFYLLDASELATGSESKTLYGPQPREDQTTYKAIHGHEYPYYYPYAPAFAFAMSPLTLVERGTALDVWRVGVALCTAILAFLVAFAFRAWVWRAAVAASVVCWEPLLLNARIGQVGALIAVLTALAVLLFLRNRRAGAVLLGVLALKPTAAIGPALIAFAERGRIWMVYLAAAAIVVMTPFLYFGPRAFYNWLEILSTRGASDLGGAAGYNQGINSLLGRTEFVSLLLFVFLVAAVLVSEKVRDSLGVEAGAAFALFAALGLNPHALIYDWGVAFVGVMLLRRSNLVVDDKRDLLCGVLAISLFVAGQLAWHLTVRDFIVRPLTGWTLLLTGGLLALALSDTLRAKGLFGLRAED